MALILDTGPLYALLDRNDHQHAQCRELIRSTAEPRIIPSPVLVELDHLISTRLHQGILLGLLEDIAAGAYAVENLELADYPRVRFLCEQYADSDIGFVDASVLAIVERLDEPKLATLDHRHFRMLRPRHVNALQLLPE